VKDPYEILGVTRTAAPDDIRKAQGDMKNGTNYLNGL
jgi:DnaJ-class molecular chaperone